MNKRLLIGAVAGALLILVLVLMARIRSSEPPSVEALRSLPYLTWVPAEGTMDKAGVTTYDRERAFDGLNLFNSRNLSSACLMDMSSTIVHEWSAETGGNDAWHHVEMCDNGDLLAIVKNDLLIRLDWDSNVKWVREGRFHHDVAIAPNGDIYAIASEDELVSVGDFNDYVLNDYFVVLSPEGEIRRKISLFDVLKDEIPQKLFARISRWVSKPENKKEIAARKERGAPICVEDDPPDILHINAVEVIDRDVDGLCKKGDVLISSRVLDLVAILDVEQARLVWQWGPGDLSAQHHPTLLENGHILIFDNGIGRKVSRVIELDPITKRIVWEYKSDPPEEFYSPRRGANQRLPNGNTLITESDRGRAFEVTPEGDIVWEFYNPEMRKAGEKRAAIYRMMRVVDPEAYARLSAK